jgi:hypothetical protein
VGIVVELAQRADAGGGDHAAIAHQHQLVEPEHVADDRDDLGERDRVGGISGKHPHRHRPARRVGEDAVFDLLTTLFAVAGVAARGQLAAPPGHPRGGQVEQRHPVRVRRLAQMPCGQLLFDVILPLGQPVHRGVDFVGGGAGDIEIGSQGDIGPPGGGGQLGRRAHHPRDDQRQHQVPCPARRPKQRGEAELVRHRRDRRHVPVRQRPGDDELGTGRHQPRTLQRRLDRDDRILGQRLEVRQRLVLDLAALAVGASQQHRLVGLLLTGLGHIDTLVPGYMHRTNSR